MGKISDVPPTKVAQMVALKNVGLTQRAIAVQVGVSQASVSKCLARHAKIGTFTAKKRPSRARVTSARTDTAIHRLARCNPHITSSAIAGSLPENGKLSARTIRRRLSVDFGLK